MLRVLSNVSGHGSMRSVEVFAGCGGLALGISRAGFKHDTVVEWDADCISTLVANKQRGSSHVRDWNIAKVDARGFDYRSLPGIDLLSGGPPCQPFSIGGKHLGPQDPRNMWPEAIRALRDIRPKAFIFENVRGLFRPDFSEYLEYIMLQLTYPDIKVREDETWSDHWIRMRRHRESKEGKRTDYRVLCRGINAADYGAPQKRHRAIFVGIASDFGADWTFPDPTHSQEALTWAKHVSRDYWKRHDTRNFSSLASPSEGFVLRRLLAQGKKPKELPWRTVRDAISDLPPPRVKASVQGHWQHPGARAYANHTGSEYDEPAKALKAGDHGVPGGENMLVNRKGNVRYFTIREMARLQGFPDDFVIHGSWKAATRQLGNAVPTVVSEKIARLVRGILRKKSQQNSQRLS
jgi:DNA (cytosine-5)-methyltransferase 1